VLKKYLKIKMSLNFPDLQSLKKILEKMYSKPTNNDDFNFLFEKN
jgi:hypothetical protein